MKHSCFITLLLVPLLALMTACGSNQSAQVSNQPTKQQSNTQSQQNKSDSDSADTAIADPTQGNWTEAYSSPNDLDGELDDAWLDCTPHNNPNPESFAWKRSTDHSKVWLHVTEGTLDGTTQRSCMADELDIADAAEFTDCWAKTKLGDHNRFTEA